MNDYKYVKNAKHGYFEAVPKPSVKELREYYEKKYYQDEKGSYSSEYSQEELKYIDNRVSMKHHIIDKHSETKPKSMVDIGCGEGHVMNYFDKKGWKVLGLDFSDFGLSTNHPQLRSKLIQGDVFEGCQRLVDEGRKFDVIWLDNVLEHVLAPEKLLELCNQLGNDEATLVIEVPNDCSDLQLELVQSKRISRRYWESAPDHLNYFSPASLKNICEAMSWKERRTISDFPIEWFLSNKNSNYIESSQVGSFAHESRVFIENFLFDKNRDQLDELVNFYESLAKVGQGRVLIGFFTKE